MKNYDRKIDQSNGRIRYERDYGRTIGTGGETGHVVIFDPNKNKIITSYPASFETGI
jgi:hypothetical protein